MFPVPSSHALPPSIPPLLRSPQALRYAFLTDWTDDVASQVRKYTVCFYPEDNTAEIVRSRSTTPLSRSHLQI